MEEEEKKKETKEEHRKRWREEIWRMKNEKDAWVVVEERKGERGSEREEVVWKLLNNGRSQVCCGR